MKWRKYSPRKLWTTLIAFAVGMIFQYPRIQESFPEQYVYFFGLTLNAQQFMIVNIVSLVVIFLSIIYFILLILHRKS